MMLGVVTISFNQRRFLEEAVRSVLQQKDHAPLKYVVVDAGSTDGSQEFLHKTSSELDCLIMESDRGPADGLNKGFSACSDCELLTYLNADDRYLPKSFAWALNFMGQQEGVDVLLGGVAIIDEFGRRRRRSRISDKFNLRKYASGVCNVFQQGTFFRQSAWRRTNRFNIENQTCWDSELLVDLAISGASFARSPRLLGEFRMHSQSITGSGRLNQQYLADQARIASKIYKTGVAPYSPWEGKIHRILHRTNPYRQLLNVLAS